MAQAATYALVAACEAAHFMSERDEAFMEQRSATRIMRRRFAAQLLGAEVALAWREEDAIGCGAFGKE